MIFSFFCASHGFDCGLILCLSLDHKIYPDKNVPAATDPASTVGPGVAVLVGQSSGLGPGGWQRHSERHLPALEQTEGFHPATRHTHQQRGELSAISSEIYALDRSGSVPNFPDAFLSLTK